VLNALIVAFVLVAIYAFVDIGVNPLTLYFERDDIGNLLSRMWAPRLDNVSSVMSHALDTFFMAFAGTVFAFVLALPLAFLAARNITSNSAVRAVARAVIVLTRALPDLVLALIFVRVWSIGVLPGIVALGIHSVGMLGKLFADAIEEIDEGPRDGVAATGASRIQELTGGVLPQIVPGLIAVTLYRLDINFRSATLLGIVGAGGIGLDIKVAQGALDYPQLLGVTLVIIAMIVVFELISTGVRSVVLGQESDDRSWLSRLIARRLTNTVATHKSAAIDGEPIDDDQHRPETPSVGKARTADLRPPWNRERITMYAFAVVCVLMLVLAPIKTGVSVIEFITGLPDIPTTFWRLVPTDFSWWDSTYTQRFVETVLMGFAATALALIFAIPTGFLAARNVAPARWVYGVARTFILGMRALPDLIVAVIFVAALGLGPKPGVLALAIGLYAFASKLFADSIEEVSEGPRDGIRSTGASPVQESFTGVLSQAMPSLAGNSLYLLDIAIRSSTILGIVGGGGIGFVLISASRLLMWDVLGGLLAITFVLVYAIELLSGWVRKQLI
jgi:phosphonate transport system permease protein